MNKHFPKIRWAIMILGFIVSTFGVYVIGRKFTQVYLPVFICPINGEGSIQGACYRLSHLDAFLGDRVWMDMGIFLLCLVGFTVIFGRMLCGFWCPFGFMQDLIYKFRGVFNESSLRFGEKYLPVVKIVKWGFLFIFFWVWVFGINFCDICPVVAYVPPLAGTRMALKASFFVAAIVTAGSFFKSRFWCNVCPLGFAVGLFHSVSLFKLEKDCQACTECGACYEACPMEIKSIYTERVNSNITTTDCLFCSECVKVCPEDKALSISFAGKKIYTSSREDFFHNNK